MSKREGRRREGANGFPGSTSTYDQWINSLGLPVHSGYFIEDLRTIAVGRWEERQCDAAFLVLAGQEGVSEVRITEIPSGKTTAPWKMALDEIVYVVDGKRGVATIRAEGKPKITFEWQKHSLFMIPRNHYCQFSNLQGTGASRLLHYNSLPLAMSLHPDPDFFFKNPYVNPELVYDHEEKSFYSEAKAVHPSGSAMSVSVYWSGNFFPDMKAWNKLVAYRGRGAGGHVVRIRYPKSQLWNHMSVFPSRTYKKAHRHGAGTLVVIPDGTGYSYLWPEGKEKILVPWHEASVFVPPNRWYHQHFNVGIDPAKYLAFHSPRGSGPYVRDQIEYPDEDQIIRRTFETELAKIGMTSLMPEEAYTDREFEWPYGDDD